MKSAEILIDIIIKEYETLRQEILAAMTNKISILSFGLATIGAVFAASVVISGGDSILPGLILSITVPLISNFVLFMWLGEHQRIQRAGKFLVGLEKRINDEASKNLLTWETSLREQQRHMKYPYNTTILLLLAISISSFIIGILILHLVLLASWLFLIVGVLIHIAIYFITTKRISEMQN
jgi:hypothetical protein